MNITLIIMMLLVMGVDGVLESALKTLAIQTITLAIPPLGLFGVGVGTTIRRASVPRFAATTAPRTRAAASPVVFPDPYDKIVLRSYND